MRTLHQCVEYLGISSDAIPKVELHGISSRSQDIEIGDLFVALPGAHNHGISFLSDAIARGARAILTDSQGLQIATSNNPNVAIPIIVKEDPRSYLGELSQWFYGSPSRTMPIFGVTGTNGKTTTTYLLHQIWRFAGRETGLIGTVGIKVGAEEIAAGFTTPEADTLQQLLATMRERHISAVAMEVSSHALVQGRVRGTHFAAAGFTHLTQDHLDFHETMENYYQAKRSLFTNDYCDKAIITIDDEYGRRLFNEATIPCASLSLRDRKATWHLDKILSSDSYVEISIRGEGGILIEGEFRLPGEHNLQNLLLATALAYESGIDPVVIGNSLTTLRGAPGRLEEVHGSQTFRVFIDYAHTPDAVTRVLATARAITSKRVIAVLGCGGDRDSSKRPLMGAALNSGADIPIFTSDNPRSEDPQSILDEMMAGVAIKSDGVAILDRRAAIHHAINIAGDGDVVLILGKGHEVGQEINGIKHPFSDLDVAAKEMASRS